LFPSNIYNLKSQIDSDLLILLDSSTSTPDLSSISSTIPGAVMVVSIDHPPYNTAGYKLLLSGYSTLVWVSVSSKNMGRCLGYWIPVFNRIQQG
jgi:hypothetical protein